MDAAGVYRRLAGVVMGSRNLVRIASYVAVTTLVAVAGAVVLAWIGIPLIGVERQWRHFGLVVAIGGILAPLIALPRAVTKMRLLDSQTRLERLAHTDSLTGLLNRRAFFDRVEQIFRPSKNPAPVAVMMIDIDHFKRVNDSFGHAAGDVMIQAIANCIEVSIAAADATTERLIARFGGEEFAVLVQGLDLDAASELAECIVRDVRSIVWWHGHAALTTTVSIGLALREPGESIDRLLKAADDAVYAAKRAGRDCWRAAADEEVTLQPSLKLEPRPLRAGPRGRVNA
jgi:diguanylate cyclase (GGDEF)-like protein